MRIRKLLAILMLSASANSVFASDFPELVIMTEEYAPYNFREDNKVQGIAVDLMVEMLKKVGSSQSLGAIKLMPWARAYRDVQEKPNAVLFSTTRTKERENLFKWVCPIYTLRTEMVALKSSNIKINSAADLLKYKIGCVRDDVGEQLAVAAGIPLDKMDRTSSYEKNVQKLAAKRMDLYVSSMTSVTLYAEQLGIDPNLFESVHILDESHLCYAFNPAVPDGVIKRLQTAYDELISDGTFDRISKQYREK